MKSSVGISLKGKKVLITGGLGFIGSNLAHACVKAGAKVTAYDSLCPNCGGNLFNVQDIRKRIKIVRGDILDVKKITPFIRKNDILFNCAAISSHMLSIKEPTRNFEVNSKAVLEMLEIIRRVNKNARFVQVGTATQFGRLIKDTADETHPEFPTEMYSAHKMAAEKYALIYHRVHGLFVSVVRLSNVFGPRAAVNNIGLAFNNYFIGLALQGKEISIYGDGLQQRNMVYVDDAVRALMLAATREAANGQVFLAVASTHCTVADFARLTVQHIGAGQVRFIPWPAEKAKIEVGHVRYSNARIRRVLGWQPEVSLAQGLRKTKAFYDSCLKKYIS